MVTTQRSAKGTVSVEVFQERLRLRWRQGGKRYTLSIGLPDSKVNRTVAQQKASQIQLDLISGNFDPTLKKYKPCTSTQIAQIGVATLFAKFCEYKAKSVSDKTMEKYRATLGYITRFFESDWVSEVDVDKAEKFADWLSTQNLSSGQRKRRIEELRACWNWALTQEFTEKNPWIELPGRLKVPPKQMPKPFSREEVHAIIQGFRADRYYYRYADYVEFLFGTGCRTGEAIGLRWRHISDDCSTVWIGESISRGVHRATKTNKARTITLTSRLQTMLAIRRQDNPAADSLVFPAPKGGAIDDHNFRNRAWKKVLTKLDIDYRKPYNTRHTLISHALAQGMNPVEVAQLTGHDVQTLYENYAGSVNSRPRLPEIS